MFTVISDYFPKFMWEFTVLMSFRKVNSIIIHQNTDAEIAYFLKEYREFYQQYAIH